MPHDQIISRRKIFYDANPTLNSYLDEYGRSANIPDIYDRMRGFSGAYPHYDADGHPTLWESVIYDAADMRPLYRDLATVYALLKTGATKVAEHLSIERIDFCAFGNSRPFRVRVVNRFNDNYDHFYVKVADASRIYGLELEHILSPNWINYIISGGTLIEEHIIGIPGDRFLAGHMDSPSLNRVRLAKEFVKFNERCFIRLLGDMRSYNYVIDVTPDFEDIQYRVRAIDFDQQSYEGRVRTYLPQFFKENCDVVTLCTELLNYPTMGQYQQEERSLIGRRAQVAGRRLPALLEAMASHDLAPAANVAQLRSDLAELHQTSAFDSATSMGTLVRAHLAFQLDR
jgi:hypothetical protein